MSEPATTKTINDYIYDPSNNIGKGCSSHVYRAMNQKTGQQVALKVLSLSEGDSAHVQSMANAEIKALNSLQGCDHIVKLYRAIRSKNNIYLILEYCTGGNLHQALKKQKFYSEHQALALIQQISRGYLSIAEQGILHRDIKPTNIFLDKYGELKIGDFGFATDEALCQQALYQNVGSPLYMPPETLTKNIYSFKSDIWALGVILIQLLTGKTPWLAKTEKALAYELATFKIKDIIPRGISAETKVFIERTLERDVAKRMDLNQLVNFVLGLEASEGQFSPSFMTYSVPIQQQTSQKKVQKIPPPIPEDRNARGNQSAVEKSNKKKKNLSPIIEEESPIKVQVKISPARLRRQGSFQSQNNLGAKITKESEESQDLSCIKMVSIGTASPCGSSLNLPLPSSPFQQRLSLVRPPPILQKEESARQLNQNHSVTTLNADSPRKLQRNTSLVFPAERTISISKATPKHVRDSSGPSQQQMEVEMAPQLQSQISYFRFLFKLTKRINDYLKTTDRKILQLKNHLACLVFQKLTEVKELRYMQLTFKKREQFMKSKTGKTLQQLTENYRRKYEEEFKVAGVKQEWRSQRHFLVLLTYLLNRLYSSTLKIEQDRAQLQKKRALIFIIEDLATLSQLFMIERHNRWEIFHWQAAPLLQERKVVSEMTLKQWQRVKQRCLVLSEQ